MYFHIDKKLIIWYNKQYLYTQEEADMKKTAKKLILIFLIILVCIVSIALCVHFALNNGTKGLKYKSNGDGTCYVSGIGKATDTEIIIPILSPGGSFVTGIADSAFEGCDKIESIELHGGIKYIGADAFYNCHALKLVEYGNAYYLGNTSNPYQILIKAASTEIANCEIHPDTEIIYGSAFSGCSELERIDVPKKVRYIGSYAFAWCEKLSWVTLDCDLKMIEEYAFLDCASLKEIKLPRSVEQIENWAFAFCRNIETVSIEKYSRMKSIGEYSFYSCEKLTGFDLDALDELESIGYAAFAGCKDLLDVTAPSQKIKIGELAFLDCALENKDTILKNAQKTKREKYTADLVQSVGALNTVLKTQQLKNLNFFAENLIHVQTDDLEGGKMHVGLPYSSTRIENLFVPNFVSLYSFMTSVKNPNSYLYSVDMGELGNVNGDTYYGAVCSTFCSYALGIDGIHTTYQWKDIPGMEILSDQSIHALSIGDSIVGDGHVVIVTNILRDASGKVYSVTVTDIWREGVRERKFTQELFANAFPTDRFTYCRYKKIIDSEYKTQPFVPVHDQTPKTFNYNTDIIPRKGDRSNWLTGTDVEIDVLNAKDYTAVEIYKDETLIEALGVFDTVVLSDLGAGSYKARLIGEEKSSDFCYWIVVDAVSKATVGEGEGEVNVTFSATNAKPEFIVWQDSDYNGTKHMQFLTDSEIAAGEAIGRFRSGDYKVRVAFRTEYGVIFSELPRGIEIP